MNDLTVVHVSAIADRRSADFGRFTFVVKGWEPRCPPTWAAARNAVIAIPDMWEPSRYQPCQTAGCCEVTP